MQHTVSLKDLWSRRGQIVLVSANSQECRYIVTSRYVVTAEQIVLIEGTMSTASVHVLLLACGTRQYPFGF